MVCLTCCLSLSFQSSAFIAAASHVVSILAGLPAFSLSSRRYDKSWVPLGSSSGPSLWALGSNSHGLSPFQFLLCLDPICDAVCQHFHEPLLRFSSSTLSNLLPPLLGLMCFLFYSSNEILLSWSHSSFALSSFPDSFVSSLIPSSWMSSPPQSFFPCLNDETKHSVLCHFSCPLIVVHVPAPYIMSV